ncbi:MAG: 23S rRNA (adenine(2503)-C(2))-methyltransferase RlmN [Pirellulaceae bacterium]|nr:23S rRNA (adenine(2503)-C(2))-methyltransferase RlmN [Planctomycetales bacterium]
MTGSQEIFPVERIRPTLHDVRALDDFRKRFRIDPYRIRRMQYGLYRMFEPQQHAMARLGPEAEQRAYEHFDTIPLHLSSRHDSQVDGSTKLVLQAHDGARWEAVLMRAFTGRTSVCISTQVGCQAGCPFCATARMGLKRNLSTAEVLEQVLIAGRLAKEEGRRLRNVVFMGMGEPLDNESVLFESIERLAADDGCAFPLRRLLVSTVGVPDAMCRLIDRFPGIHMALSLHSAKPELRNRLVPWNRRHGWDELRGALAYVAARHNQHRHQGPVMVEHILVDGMNDSREDAEALIQYVRGLRVHVNLIPYNPIPGGPPWLPTPRPHRDHFANWLREAGIFTTIRYSLGSDIQAACGQLAQS